jgi:hypothetical protein
VLAFLGINGIPIRISALAPTLVWSEVIVAIEACITPALAVELFTTTATLVLFKGVFDCWVKLVLVEGLFNCWAWWVIIE